MTQKISTHASKISMGAVTACQEWIHYPLSAALRFVSGWHHHHSLTLCQLQCLWGVLLWWKAVIYFHGVPSLPLLASSTSTSLSDCLHRIPFNNPQTIALNYFYSVEGYTCRWGEQTDFLFPLVKTKRQSHLNVSWSQWHCWRIIHFCKLSILVQSNPGMTHKYSDYPFRL